MNRVGTEIGTIHFVGIGGIGPAAHSAANHKETCR